LPEIIQPHCAARGESGEKMQQPANVRVPGRFGELIQPAGSVSQMADYLMPIILVDLHRIAFQTE